MIISIGSASSSSGIPWNILLETSELHDWDLKFYERGDIRNKIFDFAYFLVELQVEISDSSFFGLDLMKLLFHPL